MLTALRGRMAARALRRSPAEIVTSSSTGQVPRCTQPCFMYGSCARSTAALHGGGSPQNCNQRRSVASSAAPPGPAATAATPDEDAHNDTMRRVFSSPDTLSHFVSKQPDTVEQRLARVVRSVPGLGPSSRVIDIGAGTGCLVPHFRSVGVEDVLAVDLAQPMLDELEKRYSPPGEAAKLGNNIGVRTWCGDVMNLPAYQGPADAFFFNSVFGNLWSPRDALLKAALMLKPGGHIAICHPLGWAWHAKYRSGNPELVPHPLPDRAELEALVRDLPLTLSEYVDEEGLYLAVLQVPPGYALPNGPVEMAGTVVRGFGRGSAQMGVPTANIDPAPLADVLAGLPKGVYLGWAALDAPAGWPDADRGVHKMVMNIGTRPTVDKSDAPELSVEVHIMHTFWNNFHGEHLRVVATSFVRPEMRFPGIDALVTRIHADIAAAKYTLDEPWAQAAREQLRSG
mmetsp:Transcript_7828/g.23532  ORF Transcript_7828/g.23532 Transcript_7828/m.23532 type:complete len:455 (-) Transcript_7828:3051-4415(-)